LQNAHSYTVLIVDDEPGNVESLSRIFQREGYNVLTATHGREGLDLVRQHPIDVVLCDIMMPQMDGLSLLKAIKAISAHTEVITMTAYGSIERAVEAIKQGAYDFITKPLKRRDILKLVEKALDRSSLLQENQHLRQRLQDIEETPLIVGQSPALRRTMDIVKQAAPTDATVLIQGESGTGKELIARELHRLSHRGHQKFVALNCAAFPETLLDSELFGYEKGAFTGANNAKPGRFELAHGGTLFLDEIGEIVPSVQVKLLRVLQNRRIERLGGTLSTPIDIRLIAATNKNLRQEVKQGRFREDLYYRLHVIEIHIPPLRERPDDIPLLAQHFLDKYAQKNRKPLLHLEKETIEILKQYAWPGNVRQLENVIERAVVLAPSTHIKPSDLPTEVHQTNTDGNYFIIPFGTPLDEIERHVISETLRRTDGDKKLTAQLLGVATRTIYRKIEAFQDGDKKTDDEKPLPIDESEETDLPVHPNDAPDASLP
jgi:two-component system response regulator HydG